MVVFTVATVGVLLVHVPPVALLPNANVYPRQAFEEPVIGPNGFTVTFFIEKQPVVVRINEIGATPPLTPVTIPLDEPTVAIEVLPEAQVPPPVLLVNVIVCVAHTTPGPVDAAGSGCTVTTAVVVQLPPSE